MPFVALSQRLASNQVPLILAGPLLRHVAHDQVTVFLALREARTITLRVYSGKGSSRTRLMEGSRDTVPLGNILQRNALHVVAVTATVVPPIARLVPQTTYYYDLDFGTGQTLASAGVLELAATTDPLAYPGADLPSFALPPVQLDQVRLVHASCRKPHGESVDALTAVDDMIAGSGLDASTPAFALARPHQLFLTGDQIYADDVADTLLYLLVDAASALLGWQESLPDSTAANLAPGARYQLSIDAGLTSGIPDETYPKSHLMRFGEYAAMYLFAWSPTLWPATLPDAATIGSATNAGVLATETARIESFRATLPAVRRALANVPSYMVFDDHEITDDWFMNRRWVGPLTTKRPKGGLLASPLGRRIVQNGLLAYALFQAWGSTPNQFAATGALGEPGRALLVAAANWRGAAVADAAHDAEVAARVGMPPAPLAAIATALTRPAGALRWHYRVAPDGGRYEVLVLDCRTCREYPAGADTLAAALLTGSDIAEQVTSAPNDPNRQITFVVAQTPVLGLPWVERQQRDAREDLLWQRDVEAWSLNEGAYQRLLAAVALRRPRAAILSGDVHYTFVARMTYWATRPYGHAPLATPFAAAIAQLNSSALKNQTAGLVGTVQLHQAGFNQPPILVGNIGETVEQAGWREPQTSNLQVSGTGWVLFPQRRPPGWDRRPAVISPADVRPGMHFTVQPEWRYRVEYLRGQKPATPVTEFPRLPMLPPDKNAAAGATRRVHDAYRRMARNDQGRDIVGRNNIGELRVEVDGAGVPVRVVQQTWWRFRDDVTPVATTTYTVPLDPAVPPPPGPLP